MHFPRHQRVLFRQLSEDGDELNVKEAHLLVNILGVLSPQLDTSSKKVTALYHKCNRANSLIPALTCVFLMCFSTV